jgi:hypothetical protein
MVACSKPAMSRYLEVQLLKRAECEPGTLPLPREVGQSKEGQEPGIESLYERLQLHKLLQ